MAPKDYAKEYKKLVKQYEEMFHDYVPALEETDWDVFKNIKIIKDCIKTGKAFVHEKNSDDIIC